MSEQPVDTTAVEQEDVQPPEIDPDHPYVQASLTMDPEPVPVIMNVEPMILELDGGKALSAQFTISTPSGVSVVYITPRQLAQHMTQCAETLEQFRPPESKLVVADKQDMKAVVAADKLITRGKQ